MLLIKVSAVRQVLGQEPQIILSPKEKENLNSLLSLAEGKSPDLSLSQIYEDLGTARAIFALQFIEAGERDVEIELRNFAYQCAQQAYTIFDSIYNEPWLNDSLDTVKTDYLKLHEMELDKLSPLYELFPIPRDEQGAQSALIAREALGCIVDALDVYAPSAAQSAGESLLELLKNPGIHPDTSQEGLACLVQGLHTLIKPEITSWPRP